MLCLSLEGSHKVFQVVLEKKHVQLFSFYLLFGSDVQEDFLYISILTAV